MLRAASSCSKDGKCRIVCRFAGQHVARNKSSHVPVLWRLLQIEATDDFGADHVLHICNRFSNLTSLALSNVPNAINDTCVTNDTDATTCRKPEPHNCMLSGSNCTRCKLAVPVSDASALLSGSLVCVLQLAAELTLAD